MTLVAHAIAAITRRLAAAQRDEARLKAELLAAHVLRMSRLEMLANHALAFTAEQESRLHVLGDRVAAGEPLQYVLGEAWFWGRRFLCDRRALIPRPETEELVQRVLDDAGCWMQPQPDVVDVGTGTGCIALTLAAERPKARVVGVDISPDALALARENEVQLGLAGRVAWRTGDLLSGWPAGSLDVVVSNPPYIAEAVIGTLDREVKDYEPRSALAGGPDGLACIRRLAEQAVLALRPGGRLWMEMGDEQGEATRRMLTAAGFGSVQVHRDLAGHERMVEGRRM